MISAKARRMPEDAAPIARIGRYLIRRELGKGGMGVVYLADDPRLGRDVAIKVIRTELFESSPEIEELGRRFDVEARAAARLVHPGIVAIYDLGVDGDQKYIVMEYVEGTTLSRLAGLRDLPLAQALGILEQVAAALDYAHRQNVIHRDIKPANIVAGKDGVAKVMDFGIAKVDLTGFTLTSNGLVLGTLSYMSPEHIRGMQASAEFDEWSLAVTAFELLTGQRPFFADSRPRVEYLICEGYPMAGAPNAAVPGSADGVFRRALAKSPRDRYFSCTEFVRALAASCRANIAEGAAPSPDSMLREAGRKYQAGDHAGSFNLYLAAAEGGNSKAMYNTGMLYESGAGVACDPGKAAEWYRKAAGAGIAEAMNRLGLLFEQGEGVPVDPAEAVRWYRRAAGAGNKLAAGNLERLGTQH